MNYFRGTMGNYGGITGNNGGNMGNYRGIMEKFGELWGNYGEIMGNYGKLCRVMVEIWGILAALACRGPRVLHGGDPSPVVLLGKDRFEVGTYKREEA